MIYEIEDGILYSALGNDEHVEIPDGVEYITRDTFRNGKMKSIRFPESLQRISHYAFCNCAELESVRIPDGVERIDAFAFAGCEKLREVILPKALNRIRANCFYQDNALERINIPESVRRIGPKAFDCCTSLREVILPEGLEEIMDDAFRESGLRSVEIPASTRFIGTAVFNDCSDLETLILHDGLEEIGDYAFSNCALKRVELPGTLKKLGKSAFKFCHNLERFCAPDGVFTIRNGILQKYTGTAKHVVVSDGVTGIGKRLFNSCSSLTSVSIRNGLSHIDDRMFSKCSSLTSITLPDGISCIEKGAFGDTACYKNAANWSDGVFYIGEYLIEANADIPSEGYTIRLGTKYIADAAFFGRFLLTDVMIPDSVTSIGEGAFANCILLSELLNANPDCNAGQKLFGERYSGEIAALAKLYHRALTDGDLKKYILNRESWAKLDAATQADIFLAHPGEKLLIAYMDCVSDGEKMDETILNRLSDDASAKDCNTVASFMSLFVQLISSELLQRMYERLKTIRAASKAVKTIGADAVLMKKLKTTAHTGTSQTAVERKIL